MKQQTFKKVYSNEEKIRYYESQIRKFEKEIAFASKRLESLRIEEVRAWAKALTGKRKKELLAELKKKEKGA